MADRTKRRHDGRRPREMRPLSVEMDYLPHAEGSVLISVGNTRVICTATVEDRIPAFLRDKGQGWVTAEYGMIPRAAPQRIPRESLRGRPSGRTQEIQRLVGRSMRAVVDLEKLGERTLTIDCDVLQADGGTRTASITGGFLAQAQAIGRLEANGEIQRGALRDFVAATSVGIVDGRACLDLDYEEDSGAEVDMNVVMTGNGRFVEIQGTAEQTPFGAKELEALLRLAKQGVQELIRLQRRLLGNSIAWA